MGNYVTEGRTNLVNVITGVARRESHLPVVFLTEDWAMRSEAVTVGVAAPSVSMIKQGLTAQETLKRKVHVLL